MENVIKWFDFTPNTRGFKKENARQMLASHSGKYCRVLLGYYVSAEITQWAGDNFNFRFGKNELTGECFLVVVKGASVLNASKKERESTGRLAFTCKPMYDTICKMMGLDSNKPNRLHYELSENCAKTNETLTYKILPF